MHAKNQAKQSLIVEYGQVNKFAQTVYFSWALIVKVSKIKVNSFQNSEANDEVAVLDWFWPITGQRNKNFTGCWN